MANTATNNFEAAIAMFQMAYRFNQAITNNCNVKPATAEAITTNSFFNNTSVQMQKKKRDQHNQVRNLSEEIEFVLANRLPSSPESSASVTSPSAKRICRRSENKETGYQRQQNIMNKSKINELKSTILASVSPLDKYRIV